MRRSRPNSSWAEPPSRRISPTSLASSESPPAPNSPAKPPGGLTSDPPGLNPRRIRGVNRRCGAQDPQRRRNSRRTTPALRAEYRQLGAVRTRGYPAHAESGRPVRSSSVNGARMDRHAADRTVKRLARRAGITKRISPHSLRHSFITAALDAGVPLRDVQDAASHADPRTTMRYDRARHSLDRHAT